MNPRFYISFITELELLSYANLTQKEKETILEFFSFCTIIGINQNIKNNAIKYRSKYALKLPDSIILATSKYLNIPLITADLALKKVDEVDLLLYKI